MICPLCGSKTDVDYKPFCSSLCKDRDLLSWLNEDYKIPAGCEEEIEEKDA